MIGRGEQAAMLPMDVIVKCRRAGLRVSICRRVPRLVRSVDGQRQVQEARRGPHRAAPGTSSPAGVATAKPMYIVMQDDLAATSSRDALTSGTLERSTTAFHEERQIRDLESRGVLAARKPSRTLTRSVTSSRPRKCNAEWSACVHHGARRMVRRKP